MITATRSQIVFKVLKAYDDIVETEVIEAQSKELLHFDRIWFEGLEAEFYQISERDKKDILRGLEYGANVIGLACASSAEHVDSLRDFLDFSNARHMKIFAKIETKS